MKFLLSRVLPRTNCLSNNAACGITVLMHNKHRSVKGYATVNPTKLTPSSMNIFDRNAKILQKERAAAARDVAVYDYLKEEIGFRLSDRIFDIKRKFEKVVDLGCGRGYVSKHILADVVEEVIMCDSSPTYLEQAVCPEPAVKCQKLEIDEENLPFEPNSVDLVISNLSLHWVNNLPGTFEQINTCLKNDGVFLASVFGGDTLFELRCSLQLAELEREGGVAPHISPFTAVRDIGGLLTRSNFTMLTVDTDEIVINYPSMFEVMWDLKGMGENNAAWRRKTHIPRDTLLAAAAIYDEMYGNNNGRDGTRAVPATYQIFYMVGWKPDPSQPKPLQRGTGEISLKDLHRLEEIISKSGTVDLSDKDKS